MYKDKVKLTELAQEYLQTHNYEYPNGQKAPDPSEPYHRL
jgi:hypothetical protein